MAALVLLTRPRRKQRAARLVAAAAATVVALSMVATTTSAGSGSGFSLVAGRTDSHGCHSLQVWKDGVRLKTLAADNSSGECAVNTTSATLANGNFVFDWVKTNTTLFYDNIDYWGSDGTTAGTQRMKSVITYKCDAGWKVLSDRVFIWESPCAGKTSNDSAIWGTFGTRASTSRLPVHDPSAGANPGDCSIGPSCLPLFVVVGHRIVFVADTRHLGRELWVSTGRVGGTNVLKDIRPGAASSKIRQLHSNGTEASFTADDGHGRVAWVSNGTVKGTHKKLN